MSGDGTEFEVRFEANAFYLVTNSDMGDLRVTTGLHLDVGSEAHKFEVVPLLRTDLHENAVREVFLAGGTEDVRIGWIIPANALSSDAHDRATDSHFLKYAYVTIREVLRDHQRLFAAKVRQGQAQGVLESSFADLFHDNVCFLAVSMKRFPDGSPLEWLKPSLIGEGYVPFGASDPDSLRWIPHGESVGKKVKLKLIGPGIAQPEVAIKMMTIAAATSSSPVTQFFYLYQVVEFLMEVVLRTSIATIGSEIGRSIEAGRFQALRDHLEDFQAAMSEKHRLKLLMECCVGSGKAVGELEQAAADFLCTVEVKAKTGISSLYQVRNFVVHQVRSMPDEAEEQLLVVVHEFARFLSAILATFEADQPDQVSAPAVVEDLTLEEDAIR
ncbi:hypothetical protein C6I20_04010 [Aeromicrobium sp. A1-2]|uniref:hypothetical protein n=1 Tax=Aeromicrobium sp. A1-2 TaxID=2107713 RepID=UPI000E4EF44F|nr:hypothetical protein [Aeromicrobium sp. A1-2]AXT84440.1 hypothetical protein C6I20_04010 [Aeromicrobium sp. A1-2]